MIVVHSCTSNSYSGLEQYVVDLAHDQNRNQRNHSVLLFCREGSLIHKNAVERKIPVWTIGENEFYGPKLWLQMRPRWRQVLGDAKKNNQSIVLHMHAAGELWYHLPWLMLKDPAFQKKILHYHLWISHKKKDPLHWMLYSTLDEIWTSSQSAKENFEKILPVSKDKIKIIPYARDLEALSVVKAKSDRAQVRGRFSVSESDVLATCVTRFEKIKGVRELFEAFVQVAPKFQNAHLLIVGDASKNNPEAQKYTDQLRQEWSTLPENIKSRLHMPGYLQGVDEILAVSDFYVLPSYEECMSLAMLDSAALELPILGTNSGGTPSVVVPNETGFLAEPRSVDDLRAGLEKLFLNRELREKMGKAIRKKVDGFGQSDVLATIERQYLS